MPLEDLVATIEKLKGRIEKHRPLLVHSEALTRYVLIDPLLRELGWARKTLSGLDRNILTLPAVQIMP